MYEEDIILVKKLYGVLFLLNVAVWRWGQQGRLTLSEKYVILRNLYAVVNTS